MRETGYLPRQPMARRLNGCCCEGLVQYAGAPASGAMRNMALAPAVQGLVRDAGYLPQQLARSAVPVAVFLPDWVMARVPHAASVKVGAALAVKFWAPVPVVRLSV